MCACFEREREVGERRSLQEREYYNFHVSYFKFLRQHGSRLTNFVGILSQGLRIAPPEAPVTGYMFGKGVYFADMVSKSANYVRWATEGQLTINNVVVNSVLPPKTTPMDCFCCARWRLVICMKSLMPNTSHS